MSLGDYPIAVFFDAIFRLRCEDQASEQPDSREHLKHLLSETTGRVYLFAASKIFVLPICLLHRWSMKTRQILTLALQIH